MSDFVHRDEGTMSDAGEALGERVTTVCPTLYIGLGRTGREVLTKLRQRLADSTTATRDGTGPIAGFPFNAFLLFGWAAFVRNQENFPKAQVRSASSWMNGDPEFGDEEIIDCDFSMGKYRRDADSLNRYPVIADWLGSQKRISKLIAAIEGAPHHSSSAFGRPRWWSRLRTFDAHHEIRERVQNAVLRLKRHQYKKEVAEQFGLGLCSDRFRVVIVCSLAGDVGSGSFLDFGWLAGWIAHETVGDSVHVDLVATLPYGPATHRNPRAEAHAYAALMELETAMRGHSVGRFISRWDPWGEPDALPKTPFDDVYLVEPGVDAGQVLDQRDESCQMIANALFDDIGLGGYTRKLWLRVHQRRFKVFPLRLEQFAGQHGAVKLTLFKGYSAFGQAELDTQQARRSDLSALELFADAVDACFGEASPEVSRLAQADAKPQSMEHKLGAPAGDAINSVVQGQVIESKARALRVQIQADIRREIERVRKEIGKGGATRICVEPPAPDDSPVVWGDRPKCVLALASELGDRDALLDRLSEPSDRVEWAREAKRKALAQVSKAASVRVGENTDPLTLALSQMSASERTRTFKEWLDKSMPWLGVNLTNEFDLEPNQCWCLIGVTNARDFEKRFRSEIAEAFALTKASVRHANFLFEDMSAYGRAMCYVELSGIPLAALRGLEAWRASYLQGRKQEADLHTHIDAAQFVDPAIPREVELEALAGDFKYYLLAVMLQVLTPAPEKSHYPGSYQFAVHTGETLRMGNERSFRKNGLPPTRRDQIINRVNDKIDALGKTQMAALAILAGHYEFNVYAPKKVVIDEAGTEEFRKGFAGTLAGEAARELTDRALRRGLSEREFERLKDKALERLSTWAAPIEGSDSDAYEWEVGEADAETGPRLKYVVRKELFQEDADDALAEALGLPKNQRPFEQPPLPPPLTPTQYLLVINGQQAGPYTHANAKHFLALGQINQQTFVWRQGLTAWLPLWQVPELGGPPPLSGAMPLPSDAASTAPGRAM